MPRFLLHLYNGLGWLDGTDLQVFPDLEAAREGAVKTIRGLVADEVLRARPVDLAHFIAIRDENGQKLKQVTFGMAVSVVNASAQYNSI